MENNETWRERFDKRTKSEMYSEYSKDKLGCCGGDYCEGDHNENIKAFIAAELLTLADKIGAEKGGIDPQRFVQRLCV